MPRPGIVLLGIVGAWALTGCTALNEANAPQPTPTPSLTAATSAQTLPPWTENLVFTGELAGQMTTIVASGPGQQSECTGTGSAAAGKWVSTLFGGVGPGVYGIVVSASPYRGPGTYGQPVVTVQVHSLDNQKVWRSQPADPVTFVVAADENSGTLDAVLTNQVDTTGKLHVTGTWSCGGR
jgi:hypothetical protein